jgi:hypothetical protein
MTIVSHTISLGAMLPGSSARHCWLPRDIEIVKKNLHPKLLERILERTKHREVLISVETRANFPVVYSTSFSNRSALEYDVVEALKSVQKLGLITPVELEDATL